MKINYVNPTAYSNKQGSYLPGARGMNQLVVYMLFFRWFGAERHTVETVVAPDVHIYMVTTVLMRYFGQSEVHNFIVVVGEIYFASFRRGIVAHNSASLCPAHRFFYQNILYPSVERQ